MIQARFANADREYREIKAKQNELGKLQQKYFPKVDRGLLNDLIEHTANSKENAGRLYEIQVIAKKGTDPEKVRSFFMEDRQSADHARRRDALQGQRICDAWLDKRDPEHERDGTYHGRLYIWSICFFSETHAQGRGREQENNRVIHKKIWIPRSAEGTGINPPLSYRVSDIASEPSRCLFLPDPCSQSFGQERSCGLL